MIRCHERVASTGVKWSSGHFKVISVTVMRKDWRQKYIQVIQVRACGLDKEVARKMKRSGKIQGLIWRLNCQGLRHWMWDWGREVQGEAQCQPDAMHWWTWLPFMTEEGPQDEAMGRLNFTENQPLLFGLPRCKMSTASKGGCPLTAGFRVQSLGEAFLPLCKLSCPHLQHHPHLCTAAD